jgi:hypothetical protein
MVTKVCLSCLQEAVQTHFEFALEFMRSQVVVVVMPPLVVVVVSVAQQVVITI